MKRSGLPLIALNGGSSSVTVSAPMSGTTHPYSGSAIFQVLRDLGLIDPATIVPFYTRVRDRDDISAFRCARSGVIFLSSTDHMNLRHYVDKAGTTDTVSGTDILHPAILADDERRAGQIQGLVRGKRWLDVGTGPAGILDVLGGVASRCAAVEPNAVLRSSATARGHDVHASVEDLTDGDYDLVTLFHVLEHLLDPVGTLSNIRQRLAPGGRVWLEVPHARDALMMTFTCEAFTRFTLWSEHLVLHTRESIEGVLRAAGYADIAVSGYQRYPLSNHLHWLATGRPGGHDAWPLLNDAALMQAYSSMLGRLDQTDSLIAVASI